MTMQLITQEDFASVQQVQAGVTKLLERADEQGRFYRVMRNQDPVGVLIPNTVWESLLEDLEALSSPTYLRAIAASRKSKIRISSEEMKRRLHARRKSA